MLRTLLADKANPSGQGSAADVLRGQTKLDEATLALLVKLLADKANPSGQGSAALALRGQTKLDEATLALLRTLLADKANPSGQRYAADALSGQTKLDEATTTDLLAYCLYSSENSEEPAEKRFAGHYLGGGTRAATLLLNWIGTPGVNHHTPSSAAEKVASLLVFTNYWQSARLFEPARKEYAEQVSRLASQMKKIQGAMADTVIAKLKINEKELSDYESELGGGYAESIKSVREHLEVERSWPSKVINVSPWVLAFHALCWFLLIIAYPYSPRVQSIFFWNSDVLKWAGLGYVKLALIHIPFLRNRLLSPFRSSLLADARLDRFKEGAYFAESLVRDDSSAEPEEARPVHPLLEKLRLEKGKVLLIGESGLGKTMYLRKLASDYSSSQQAVAVYLRAASCQNGVVRAIKDKVKGVAGDTDFIEPLIYIGAIDIFIDGLNEVSPDIRSSIRQFLEYYPQGKCILTSQPIQGLPAVGVHSYRLLPLNANQLLKFLLKRNQIEKQPVTQQVAENYLTERLQSTTLLPEEIESNRRMLSNPLDLTIIGELLAAGIKPNLNQLQEELYNQMLKGYREQRTKEAGDFPIRQFSEKAYEQKLVSDDNSLDAAGFADEVNCMEAYKMVYKKENEEGIEWFFRHDKIQDFFLLKAFLVNSERQIKHLSDTKFRGVYFLLAEKLPLDDALLLREALIQHAAETNDNTVSNEFIKLVRFRTNKGSNGVEANLLNFIKSDIPVDKTTWFEFDRVTFKTGRATLKPESQEQLKNVADILKAYPNVNVKLGDFTDNKGDAANLKLSDARAQLLKAGLVQLGIADSRLEAEGYGQENPVASNDTEEGRAQNRRISIQVTKK